MACHDLSRGIQPRFRRARGRYAEAAPWPGRGQAVYVETGNGSDCRSTTDEQMQEKVNDLNLPGRRLQRRGDVRRTTFRIAAVCSIYSAARRPPARRRGGIFVDPLAHECGPGEPSDVAPAPRHENDCAAHFAGVPSLINRAQLGHIGDAPIGREFFFALLKVRHAQACGFSAGVWP